VTDDAEVSNWNLMTIYFTPYVPTTDWMGKLAGDPTLLHITIPGTHDTATYLGYGGPSAQCQTMDIAAQLAAGIRFMDLRLVVNGQDLSTYHAGVNQWVSFKDVVLPAIVNFLKNHKDECVVICVNHAKDGAPSYDALLHEILINGVPPNTLYDHNDANTFPLKVKQLRGCVVLARRDSERTFGIDMTRWADNTPNQTFDAATGMKVTLQDNYEWTDLAGAWNNKWNVVSPFLELARRTPPSYSIEASKTWFINFISAGGIVVPWDFATGALGNLGMNYRLARYLMKYSSRDGRLGTVVMDFPEQPGKGLLLTRLLLGTNTYA
jgi:1-phosphatidylinositol phosphodiesterase